MNKSNKEIFRKRLAKQSVWSKPWFYLVMVLVLVLLTVLIYQIPSVIIDFPGGLIVPWRGFITSSTDPEGMFLYRLTRKSLKWMS